MSGFDKDAYFNSVRANLFNGSMTQQQVFGQNIILREYRRRKWTDYRWLAYELATTLKETGRAMWPVTEYGSQEYLTSKEYFPYIGRGFVQLTWDFNYEKAGLEVGEDLLGYPDLALEVDIAVEVLFSGMEQGWFTGRALGDYFNETTDDPLNARQIINGNDCDEEIEGYHELFLVAITEAT